MLFRPSAQRCPNLNSLFSRATEKLTPLFIFIFPQNGVLFKVLGDSGQAFGAGHVNKKWRKKRKKKKSCQDIEMMMMVVVKNAAKKAKAGGLLNLKRSLS